MRAPFLSGIDGAFPACAEASAGRPRQTKRSGGAGRKGVEGEGNARPAPAFRRRISYFASQNEPQKNLVLCLSIPPIRAQQIFYSLANPKIIIAYDALRKALKEQLETNGKLLEKF